MADWGKYENIDAKKLNDEVQELGDGDFEDLPKGKYEVEITNMELKPTKEKGYPMLAVSFKVLEGEYKNRLIFMNQVVIMGDKNDAIRLKVANSFLQSLDSGVAINFESVRGYEELIGAIYDSIKQKGLEYLLELGERKGFTTYKIVEVFEA